MRQAPANSIGLTYINNYDDMIHTTTLADQLTAAGITVQRHDLTNIVGMGGPAHLLCYTSPKTGGPVTVLVVPNRYDVDRYSEDYFYFAGMADAQPGDADRWAALYDQCTALMRRDETLAAAAPSVSPRPRLRCDCPSGAAGGVCTCC